MYAQWVCGGEGLFRSHLLLGIGPSWNLNDHVQDGLLLVGVQGNVVEGRDWDAILLDVDAALEGVECSNLARSVDRSGLRVKAAAGGERSLGHGGEIRLCGV